MKLTNNSVFKLVSLGLSMSLLSFSSASIYAAASTNDLGYKQAVHAPSALHFLTDMFASNNRYQPYVAAGGMARSDQSNVNAAINGFLPLQQTTKALSFFQGDFSPKQAGQSTHGLTFGVRRLSDDESNLYGFSAAYDVIDTADLNQFKQVSLGGEFWHNNWVTKGSIHMPFGETTQNDVNAQKVALVNAGAYKEVDYSLGYQTVLPGGDILVGNNVWRGLTVYGGAYGFHRNGFETVAGPEALADYSWYQSSTHKFLGVFDRVSAQTGVNYDHTRGANYYAGLQLVMTLPGRSNELSGVSKHMVDLVSDPVGARFDTYHDKMQTKTDASGNPIKIRSVDSEQSLDEALQDPNAQVVAVDHNITIDKSLSVTTNSFVTGHYYTFNEGGEHFSVPVASGGQITAAPNVNQVFNIVNNLDRSVTIQDISINMNQPGDAVHAVVNQGGGIEQVNVNNVNTNGNVNLNAENGGNLDVSLTGNTIQGRITNHVIGVGSIEHVSIANTTVHSLTPASQIPSTSSPNDHGGVENIASNGGRLFVDQFENNFIYVDGDQAGVLNKALDPGSNLKYSNGLINNKINTSSGDSMYTHVSFGEVNIQGLIGNQFDGGDLTFDAVNKGAISINGFHGNTFDFKSMVRFNGYLGTNIYVNVDNGEGIGLREANGYNFGVRSSYDPTSIVHVTPHE